MARYGRLIAMKIADRHNFDNEFIGKRFLF
jgi:hypothetical protein